MILHIFFKLLKAKWAIHDSGYQSSGYSPTHLPKILSFHYVQVTEFSMTSEIETQSTDTEREIFSKFKSGLHKKDNFILLLTVAEVCESMSNPLEISGTTLL